MKKIFFYFLARPAILEYLVKKKADVNAVDIHGHTPLNEAVRQRNQMNYPVVNKKEKK